LGKLRGFVLAAIERIVDRLARQSILFLFGIRQHRGGLCDDGAPLPQAIKTSPACGRSGGIRSGAMARSISVVVPAPACLSGQPVRRNSLVRPP